MGDQDARATRRHDRLGKPREIPGVTTKEPSPWTVRQQRRALRTTLAVPVQAPHREPARDEIADRLEVFLDELRKATDNYAMRPWRRRREVPPTQCNPLGRREHPPLEPGRLKEAPVERRRHAGDKGMHRNAPVVAPKIVHRNRV